MAFVSTICVFWLGSCCVPSCQTEAKAAATDLAGRNAEVTRLRGELATAASEAGALKAELARLGQEAAAVERKLAVEVPLWLAWVYILMKTWIKGLSSLHDVPPGIQPMQRLGVHAVKQLGICN